MAIAVITAIGTADSVGSRSLAFRPSALCVHDTTIRAALVDSSMLNHVTLARSGVNAQSSTMTRRDSLLQ